MEAAEEFSGGDAAGAGGAAGVDGQTECEGFEGEAAERSGVEVEARGGGGRFRRCGGGGGEREECGLGRECVDTDFAEAWRGGGVDAAGDWWRFCGGGKVQSESVYHETHEWTRIHCFGSKTEYVFFIVRIEEENGSITLQLILKLVSQLIS